MTLRCECGETTGVRCEATGSVSVDWMPVYRRDSHLQAGYTGIPGLYPHNGAVRLRLSPTCADTLIERDPDWSDR